MPAFITIELPHEDDLRDLIYQVITEVLDGTNPVSFIEDASMLSKIEDAIEGALCVACEDVECDRCFHGLEAYLSGIATLYQLEDVAGAVLMEITEPLNEVYPTEQAVAV